MLLMKHRRASDTRKVRRGGSQFRAGKAELTLGAFPDFGQFCGHAPQLVTDVQHNPFASRVAIAQNHHKYIKMVSRIDPQVERAAGILGDFLKPVQKRPCSIEDALAMLDAKVARFSVLGPILEDTAPPFHYMENRP